MPKRETLHACHRPSRASIWEVSSMLLLIVIAWYVIDRIGIGAYFSVPQGSSDLGEAFLMGVIAASSSCLALVGGLLLSVSAKWREQHEKESKWQRFLPLFLFNIGRLVGYFVLGGLIGLLGAALNPTPLITGMITIVIAVIMVWLGLSILGFLPKKLCSLPLPAPLRHRLHALPHSANPAFALLLGAATFFIPCGFTQSMQLVALQSHDFWNGALVMLSFALGTLPALLGISLLSSISEGTFARLFLRFSGVLVFLLGLSGIRGGLLLTGIAIPTLPLIQSEGIQKTDDPFVTIDEQGRQVISLYVTDDGYKPDSFTIQKGKPTWIYALAPDGVSGCATFLLAPSFDLSTQIRRGENWLGPIENPQKDFMITCSMGMLRASVHVLPAS